MALWIVLVTLLALVVGFIVLRQVLRADASALPKPAVPRATTTFPKSAEAPRDVPFETEETQALTAAIYSLSFSVPHFDEPIAEPQASVFAAAKRAIQVAQTDQQLLPRRPALLPKLLRALNADDSSREELVRLILQDAVLAGNVLQRANSSYYRLSVTPIESVDRAVMLLGGDGLRAPVATAAMQPMFQLPRGFFEQFAPITWELGQRTAMAAEAYSRARAQGDAFVAHLLGLLDGLSRIVLFRLTLEKYREHELKPRAEVFIRVMIDEELALVRKIGAAWELSVESLAAIDAQIDRTAPLQMTPLARALYYGTLCGELAVLAAREKSSHARAAELLAQQGLDAETFEKMWLAATSAQIS